MSGSTSATVRDQRMESSDGPASAHWMKRAGSAFSFDTTRASTHTSCRKSNERGQLPCRPLPRRRPRPPEPEPTATARAAPRQPGSPSRSRAGRGSPVRRRPGPGCTGASRRGQPLAPLGELAPRAAQPCQASLIQRDVQPLPRLAAEHIVVQHREHRVDDDRRRHRPPVRLRQLSEEDEARQHRRRQEGDGTQVRVALADPVQLRPTSPGRRRGARCTCGGVRNR